MSTGGTRFAIYPFGDLGVLTKRILQEQFAIEPSYIFDETIAEFNPNVKSPQSLSLLKEKENGNIFLILVTLNHDIHDVLRENALKYIPEERILDVFQDTLHKGGLWNPRNWEQTICGRHSYGPLCNHPLVERVGSFCSLAAGSDVVNNHATTLLSTSGFMTGSGGFENVKGFKDVSYEAWKHENWYFDGIKPKGKVANVRRIIIGNDVWIGKNVIITNYSDIGDGVIAAAGAVITKPVPAYAIVAGVPARIIRYRYSHEQIAALERIKWWDWTDDVIRQRFDDMYLPIDKFIDKYI